MFILSIDIGIKFMSYCFFNIIENEKTKEIIDWNILNISNEKKYLCNQITAKKKTICNKKAMYYKEDKFYCKTHAKSSGYIIPEKDNKLTSIPRKKIYDLKEIIKKYKIPNCENLSKKEDLVRTIINYLEPLLLEEIKSSKKSHQIDFITLGQNINKQFNLFIEKITKQKYKIDVVLIENQIGNIAVRMKTLQGMVAQYFIMKGIKEIYFISSQNKLKEYEKEFSSLKKYSERKKKSIEITLNKITENENLIKWIEFFNNNKKKDDLADSFLQGCWYIKTKFNISF